MEETSRLRQFASTYAQPLILFGAVSALALTANLIPTPWNAWQPALCFPNCFCEAVRLGFVRQPANTFSNLAYVLVGLLIAIPARPLTTCSAPSRNLLQSPPGYVWLYGWSVVAIGVGSLFYHASLTLTGQFFDWVGMYAFISFVAVYSLFRLFTRPQPGWLFAGLYVVVLVTTFKFCFSSPG